MSVEAWYFLYGTTCGTCNLFYFFSLLSGMATEDTTCNKRGMTYIIHPGQADGSMLSLAKEWNIGRKAVSRLLEDFSKRGLIRIVSNPVTSIIDMVCVKSWMKDGQVIKIQHIFRSSRHTRVFASTCSTASGWNSCGKVLR